MTSVMSAPIVKTPDPVQGVIKDLLDKHTVAGVTIHQVSAEIGWDSDGEEVLRLNVVLADPIPPAETWPLGIMYELSFAANRSAGRHGVPQFVYVEPIALGDMDEEDQEEDFSAEYDADLARRLDDREDEE